MVSTKVHSIRAPHFGDLVGWASMGFNSPRATTYHPALRALSQLWGNSYRWIRRPGHHLSNIRGLDNYRVDSLAAEDFNTEADTPDTSDSESDEFTTSSGEVIFGAEIAL